jgi:hypothetical protein
LGDLTQWIDDHGRTYTGTCVFAWLLPRENHEANSGGELDIKFMRDCLGDPKLSWNFLSVVISLGECLGDCAAPNSIHQPHLQVLFYRMPEGHNLVQSIATGICEAGWLENGEQ